MSDFNLRKADNYVEVEGYLESQNIEEKSFDYKDKTTGETKTAYKAVGEIVVSVDEHTKIKFRVDVNKFTQKGDVSKIYEKAMAVKENYISRAECANKGLDPNNADRVKIKGSFDHRDHLNADKTEVFSYGVYAFNFAERISELDYKPHAKFNVEMYCADITEEKKDEEPTGRMIIDGIVPLFNRVIPLKLYFGQTEDFVDLGAWIKEHYEVGKTTKVWGIIKGEVYQSKGSSNIVGAPQVFESVSVRVVPTSIEGEQYPVTDPKHYDKTAIKAAMNARQEMLDALAAKKTDGTAPSATAVGSYSPAPAPVSAPTASTERALNW